MRRSARWSAVTALVLASTGQAAIVAEIYTTRDAFATRLGGAVQVIDFDDIDTSTVDPVVFAADRYAPHGLVVTGQAGQFASRDFGFPADYPVSSPPNAYAPGPIEDTIGGGKASEVSFVSGGAQPATVAGFGAVFIDPDLPATSTLAVFNDEGTELGSLVVPDADGERPFRGIVAVDDTIGEPVAAIARVEIRNGTGWPGAQINDGVPLDDFIFGLPEGITTTTTTTTTLLGATSTSTTTLVPASCAPAPASGCRAPVASGGAVLVARNKRNDARDALAWRWSKGAATPKADFGEPLATTVFRLCLYDVSGLRIAADVPAGGTCGGKPCWKSTPASFRYRNPSFGADGIGSVVLKAGGAGRARIALQAKGADLALALPLAPPVTVQLMRTDGGPCWDARFTTAAKNTPARFRAKSD